MCSCLAGGYPTPTYEWFKEEYENDVLTSIRIDPLSDSRYTLSGGSFIINDPRQVDKLFSMLNLLFTNVTISFVVLFVSERGQRFISLQSFQQVWDNSFREYQLVFWFHWRV